MPSPIDCPSSYFPGILLFDCSERERKGQFLRKDELIDADRSYIPTYQGGDKGRDKRGQFA